MCIKLLLISFTRYSCVEGTSNQTEYLPEHENQSMSTAENSGCLDAAVVRLKIISRSHVMKHIHRKTYVLGETFRLFPFSFRCKIKCVGMNKRSIFTGILRYRVRISYAHLFCVCFLAYVYVCVCMRFSSCAQSRSPKPDPIKPTRCSYSGRKMSLPYDENETQYSNSFVFELAQIAKFVF